MRLCSNVPGQCAVQTALGGYQSIYELTRPGGRLYQSRQAILEGVAKSKYLQVHAPQGAIYAFIGIRDGVLPDFVDQHFAMDLLEHKHVLLAPGTSFNTSYKTHFRITNLPTPEVLADVFRRMEELFDSYVSGAQPVSRPGPDLKVVGRGTREG
jgi:alanine-synthesizing transaminase